MAIKDKTRKKLWANSGKLCAICKEPLIEESKGSDDSSIIGEECHIIAKKKNGARHNPHFTTEELDSYNNLIILCRNDHKMIDDQPNYFTVEKLKTIKKDHEKFISNKINNKEYKPIIKRIEDSIYLFRVTNGKELFNITQNSDSFAFQKDELESQDVVNLVSEFCQFIMDFSEILSDLEISDIIKYEFELTEFIKKVEEKGFYVLVGTEKQLLDGGNGPASDWNVAHIYIINKTNKSLKSLNLRQYSDKS